MQNKNIVAESANVEESRFNGGTVHPDREWLKKIVGYPDWGDGWALAGTLSFRKKLLNTENDQVKWLFGELNLHLNGEYNWKNVPVYWRFEADESNRIHAHFVLLDATPEFHWIRGLNHDFVSPFALAAWLKRKWNQNGVSHYRRYEDSGWLDYLTKANPIMDSCFSPPIHYLKRKAKEIEHAEAA